MPSPLTDLPDAFAVATTASSLCVKMSVGQLVCTMLLLAINFGGHAAAVENESDAMAKATAANRAKDYATSIAIYRNLAEHGSAAAPALIGMMYFSGAGVPRDLTHACDFYAVSEHRGDPAGTELLADCFFKGEGRSQDYYFAASITTDNRIVIDPAVKSAYWGTVATRVDPDPTVRTQTQKLIELLLNSAPSLGPKVDAMLATPAPPAL